MKLPYSLSQHILDNTTATIFERGRSYAKHGKVRVLTELPKKFTAQVVGSEIYDVEFRQGTKYITGYCSCPYRENNEDYCKHIAAVAIAIDSCTNRPVPERTTVYNTYLNMIDGSDGVWLIPHARLPVLVRLLRQKGLDDAGFEALGVTLNDLVRGWGDIFSDLGVG